MYPAHASLPVERIERMLRSGSISNPIISIRRVACRTKDEERAAIEEDVRRAHEGDSRFLGPQPWDVTDPGMTWHHRAYWNWNSR
jgi:hypothetical protein